MAKPAERAFELSNRLALRPAEAADALGVSERKLREMLPELPHVHLGTAIVIPVDALRTWLLEASKRDDGPLEDRIQNILDG